MIFRERFSRGKWLSSQTSSYNATFFTGGGRLKGHSPSGGTLHSGFCRSNLVFPEVIITFYNKKIYIYHFSNDFLQFSKGWSKNTKKAQFSNFGRLPVGQFSLDLNKKYRIWVTFTYIYNIS